MVIKDRLSITDVAKTIGVTPRTIMRWEKSGKIKKSKRDWRGWRFYTKMDLEDIRKFYESTYEYGEYVGVFTNGNNGVAANVAKSVAIVLLAAGSLFLSGLTRPLFAATKDQGSVEVIEQAASAPAAQPGSNIITRSASTKGITETPKSVDIVLADLPAVNSPISPMTAPITYTLGPDDIISVDVRRHPEFSGKYTVNSEGKIEYKYVGDVIVAGLTKDEVKDRLAKILSEYIIDPDIDVQIDAYLSKVFYVVGEVGRPGKFYMRGNTITVREALMQSSLPTYASAMRRCRLITPDKTGKDNYIDVDIYKLLYEGDLRQDLVMKPNDVLYVPATALAKVLRVIMPVKDTATEVVSTAGVAAVAL